MKQWVRRVRGAIGMGLTWALAWFGAGMVLLLIVGLDAADVPFPLFFGLLGYFAGATFSAVLSLVERGRSFEEMSLPRFAGWGAVGGFLLAAVFVVIVAVFGNDRLPLTMLGPLFATAGAASAAGSLAVARRGERRELLEGGAELDGGRRLQGPADD